MFEWFGWFWLISRMLFVVVVLNDLDGFGCCSLCVFNGFLLWDLFLHFVSIVFLFWTGLGPSFLILGLVFALFSCFFIIFWFWIGPGPQGPPKTMTHKENYEYYAKTKPKIKKMGLRPVQNKKNNETQRTQGKEGKHKSQNRKPFKNTKKINQHKPKHWNTKNTNQHHPNHWKTWGKSIKTNQIIQTPKANQPKPTKSLKNNWKINQNYANPWNTWKIK